MGGMTRPGIIATLVKLESMTMKPEAKDGGATHAIPTIASNDLFVRLFIFHLIAICISGHMCLYPDAML
jgi:hypothetical protein